MTSGLLQGVLAAALVAAPAPAAPAEAPAGARLNDLQVIGSHNSYKLAIDPPLLQILKTFSLDATALDYSHATLTEQLNLGLRALELDLHHDPDGGLYAEPLGLELVRRLRATPAPFDKRAMRAPGFKLLHIADVDFRSSQPTLAAALAELRGWSAANPGHLPVIITMNLKDKRAPVPNGVEPRPFDAAALDALDAAIRSGLGEGRLLTPDTVRGGFDTLERAVLESGWPTLEQAGGRFLWVMDEVGAKRETYLEGHPSLRGRVMFTNAPAGADDAAFMIINDPVKHHDRIRGLVGKGYLVRTRSDSSTREARSGDTSRLEAALRSGAQVISTDYYRPDPRFGTGYQARMPAGGFWRPRPGGRADDPSGGLSP